MVGMNLTCRRIPEKVGITLLKDDYGLEIYNNGTSLPTSRFFEIAICITMFPSRYYALAFPFSK
jgi:hypothetical protein